MIHLLLVTSALSFSQPASSPNAGTEVKAEEKNPDAPPKAPDAGSTMTQQRMEDDSNDGRSRNAEIRSRQDIKLYDSKPQTDSKLFAF